MGGGKTPTGVTIDTDPTEGSSSTGMLVFLIFILPTVGGLRQTEFPGEQRASEENQENPITTLKHDITILEM